MASACICIANYEYYRIPYISTELFSSKRNTVFYMESFFIVSSLTKND